MSHARTPTILEAYQIFLVDRQARRFTDETLRFYRDKLGQFVAYCDDGAALLTSVTPHIIRQYLLRLQSRDLAAHTVHGAARAIRAFFRFCVAEELLDASPMDRVAMPKLDKRILPAFTPAEVRRLVGGGTTTRDRALVLFLLDTGVRAAELVKLDGRDIDAKSGAVSVREGKGRKDRTVYMGKRTTKALLRYYIERGAPSANGAVWVSLTSGERLTAAGLRLALARVGEAAQVAHCTPHTFRRTFALMSLRAGMSIYHLQRLMGHADISTLRSYLALVESDLADAHSAAGPVDHMK